MILSLKTIFNLSSSSSNVSHISKIILFDIQFNDKVELLTKTVLALSISIDSAFFNESETVLTSFIISEKLVLAK